MGEAFLRLSTLEGGECSGAVCKERYGGDPVKEFVWFLFWFSICSNLISNIITFNLIIDLNELYFYLSRSRSWGCKKQLWQLSERETLTRIFGLASDTTSAPR